MADMHHLVQADGVDAAAVFQALTTQPGITGWWTSKAEVPGATVGDVLRLSFPEAQGSWELQITALDDPARVAWRSVAGPPGWPGTEIRWALEQIGPGVVIRLDHTGFAGVDDLFRIVTVGWAQMLLSLKEYLESGQRKPFFTL